MSQWRQGQVRSKSGCPQITSLDSPVEIRQAAAVNFKNFVKYYWVSYLQILQMVKGFSQVNNCSTRAYNPSNERPIILQAPAEDAEIAIADGEKVSAQFSTSGIRGQEREYSQGLSTHAALCVDRHSGLLTANTQYNGGAGPDKGVDYKPHAEHPCPCPVPTERGSHHHWPV
jgi:hypothetical protein